MRRTTLEYHLAGQHEFKDVRLGEDGTKINNF